MKITLDPHLARLNLQFNYNQRLIEAIKAMPDRSYDPASRTWSVGFDESNLEAILAMLSGFGWPQEAINEARREATEFLAKLPSAVNPSSSQSIEQRLGQLIVDAYIDGKISQEEQGQMIELLNNFSLTGFVNPST
jgi:hypothetical protein